MTGGAGRLRHPPVGGIRIRHEESTVSHYIAIAHQIGSSDALALGRQLTAWHDRMVTHQRVLMTAAGRGCDDACPHADAVELWREAVERFGDAADRLTFLKTIANGTGEPAGGDATDPMARAMTSGRG
jgi:hypothetical protein